MANIDKIKLYNFKAFYGEETIDLGGKNLLIYGENGSGKSSIYWALYTLMQSVTKNDGETNKYFNFKHNQNLINHEYLKHLDETRGVGQYSEEIGKNVQIEIVLEDKSIFNLSLDGLSAVSDKIRLENLNRYSDFLTHRLLINFYNFRNSQEIDLWTIFLRDIFPFVYTNLDKGKKTLENIIEDLKNTQPFTVEDRKIEDFTLADTIPYFSKISLVNTEISKWVKQISNESNIFFNQYFDNKENNYLIQLVYRKKFFYGYQDGYIKNNFKVEEVQSLRKFLSTPTIILEIYKKSGDDWKKIERPQTFLNEALINQISLAIRLSLTKNRAVNYPGQFLVLDDVLISLDMSNRDKFLDIILDVFAPEYKIYLFTHEKSFFNLVKRRLTNRNLLEKWKVYEAFMNDFEIPQKPRIVDNEDYLSKALFHLKNFDLPASANYLRKECEFRMKYLLPENLAKTSRDKEETKFKILENLLVSFIKYFKETLHQDSSKFLLLKEKKDIFLNPLSHDNLDSEIYKDELLVFYNLLLELRSIKKILLLKCDEEFFFNQIDADGDIRQYTVTAKENLLYYKLLDGSIIHKNITCEFVHYIKNTIETPLSNETKYTDLQKVAYKHAMNGLVLPTYPDHLKEFYNSQSKIFQDLLTELNV